MYDDKTPSPAPAAAETEAATVPSFRLREETEKRRALETQLATALKETTSLQEQYKALEEKYSTQSITHNQDISLISSGIKDAEVRDFVRSRYSGDKPFNEWLTAQKESPSPLLAPFLRGESPAPPAPTPVEATPAPATPAPTGNPKAGVETGAPSHSSKSWGAEEIVAARSKGRGTLGDSKEAILAQLRAEGLIA